MRVGGDGGVAASADTAGAALSSRRHSLLTAGGLASALALVGLAPALAMRWGWLPVGGDGWGPVLLVVAGMVFGLGFMVVRAVGHSRSGRRTPVRKGRFLVTRTWSGECVVDLHNLVRVRAKRYVDRTGYDTYVLVRDRLGVSVAVGKAADFDTVRRAVDGMAARDPASVPRVSRLAQHALGMRRLPPVMSVLWSFGAALSYPALAGAWIFVLFAVASPS